MTGHTYKSWLSCHRVSPLFAGSGTWSSPCSLSKCAAGVTAQRTVPTCSDPHGATRRCESKRFASKHQKRAQHSFGGKLQQSRYSLNPRGMHILVCLVNISLLLYHSLLKRWAKRHKYKKMYLAFSVTQGCVVVFSVMPWQIEKSLGYPFDFRG